MKKFAIVASLVALSGLGLAGCSSTPELAANETTTDMPSEVATDIPNAASNTGGAEPQTGAVVDTANPSTTVADNSAYTPPTFTDTATAPAKSPVNLGASSAGRAR